MRQGRRGQQGHRRRPYGRPHARHQHRAPAARTGRAQHPARGVRFECRTAQGERRRPRLPQRGADHRARLAGDHRARRPDDAHQVGRGEDVDLARTHQLPEGLAVLPRRHHDRVPARASRWSGARRRRSIRGGAARRLGAAARRRPLDGGPEQPGRAAPPHGRLRRALAAHRRSPGRDARARARPRQDPDGRDGSRAGRSGPPQGRAPPRRLGHRHPHPRRHRPGPAGHGRLRRYPVGDRLAGHRERCPGALRGRQPRTPRLAQPPTPARHFPRSSAPRTLIPIPTRTTTIMGTGTGTDTDTRPPRSPNAPWSSSPRTPKPAPPHGDPRTPAPAQP